MLLRTVAMKANRSVLPPVSPMIHQACPFSTMRTNIARMLLTTNTKSHIVDISHDADLKRGRTTSGELQGNLDRDNERLRDKMTEKFRDISQETTDNMGSNKQELDTLREKSSMQRLGDKVSSSSRKHMMDKTKHAEEYDTLNQMDANTIDRDRKASETYDRGREIGKQKLEELADDPSHEIPGTGRLKGTLDNFDNDPGISLEQMQDKLRETKDKITVGAEHVLDSVKETARGAKETAKGMTEKVKEMVTGETHKENPDESRTEHVLNSVKETALGAKETAKEVKEKVKEFVTGEKSREKPDESRSEVRMKKEDVPKFEEQKKRGYGSGYQ